MPTNQRYIIRTKYLNKFRFVTLNRNELNERKYVEKGNVNL